MSENPGYNERIFSKGLRSKLHHARFYWVQRIVRDLIKHPPTVLELGCFDAKTISFLPMKPVRYEGYDANWENGLDIARKTYLDPGFAFHECSRPEEMNPKRETFDLVICMETLEHLPDDLLDGYLAKLKEATHGIMLVSVPNETGIVFLAKYLVKLLVYREKINPHYSFQDVLNQTFGRMDRVAHDDHKGFDFWKLYETLMKEGWVVTPYAIPFGWLPYHLGFSVGMLCVRKDRDARLVL